MPINHIQFQPGLSLPEFFAQFGTESQCEAALEHALSVEASGTTSSPARPGTAMSGDRGGHKQLTGAG